jgi:hypothetical protein
MVLAGAKSDFDILLDVDVGQRLLPDAGFFTAIAIAS